MTLSLWLNWPPSSSNIVDRACWPSTHSYCGPGSRQVQLLPIHSKNKLKGCLSAAIFSTELLRQQDRTTHSPITAHCYPFGRRSGRVVTHWNGPRSNAEEPSNPWTWACGEGLELAAIEQQCI